MRDPGRFFALLTCIALMSSCSSPIPEKRAEVDCVITQDNPKVAEPVQLPAPPEKMGLNANELCFAFRSSCSENAWFCSHVISYCRMADAREEFKGRHITGLSFKEICMQSGFSCGDPKLMTFDQCKYLSSACDAVYLVGRIKKQGR